MNPDIEKILFNEKEIAVRVQEMGQSISKDYNNVVAVGILKRSGYFLRGFDSRHEHSHKGRFYGGFKLRQSVGVKRRS